jgi:hypothetical protein
MNDIAAERFEKDAAEHKLTVLNDHGLYRHLRFANPANSFYWFDLITVPGALIFQGDGETFAFRRTEDMFVFFRSGIWPDGSIRINPGYWDEKLTSDRGAATRYSEDRLRALVDEQLADAEETYPGVSAEWAELIEDEYNLEYEADALRALHDFSFGAHWQAACSCAWQSERFEFSWAAEQEANGHRCLGGDHEVTVVRDHGFTFDQPERMDELRDHYWWFLWACHAIVWGIQQYDAAKAGRAVPAGVRALVADLNSRSGFGESCWIVPTPKRWAVLVPRRGGGLPYFTEGRQRKTVEEAVRLGLIRLGDALEPLPAHSGAPTWLERSVPQPLQGYRITASGGAA